MLMEAETWVALAFVVFVAGLLFIGVHKMLAKSLDDRAIAKISLNVLATTAVCLVSYHFCVRSTAVGQLLNGRRHPHHTQGKPAHAF